MPKIKDLKGYEHPWPPTGKEVHKNDSIPRSNLHVLARSILKSMYPTYKVLEEVLLPGTNGMRLDFYLPQPNFGVEVHGEQHYKFVPHFHGSIINFRKSKVRDEKKKEYCVNNGIVVVELPYNESEDEWRQRIKNR